jgi:hypothetical protein
VNVGEFRRVFDVLTPHGWLTVGEALLLIDYADRTEGPIVEVGSYYGRSAMLLASLGRPLVCIDPWEDKFSAPVPGDEVLRHFRENLSLVPNAAVTVVRKRVEDWKPVSAGFVYLDGSHTYDGTIAQIKKALSCNPIIIAIHDVNDSGGGLEVKRASIELLGPWLERTERMAVWRVKDDRKTANETSSDDR